MQDKNYSFIIADHVRAASFIIAEGVLPSGKQRGYVLRRLIRRALSASVALGIDIANRQYFEELVDATIGIYDGVYDELKQNRETTVLTLVAESTKYQKAMLVGRKEWEKLFAKRSDMLSDAATTTAWNLYQTHGVPFEVSESECALHGVGIDVAQLEILIENHQKQSQEASGGQFKSGLATHTDKTRRLHTATHLLQAVLREMFGSEVRQVGSAITEEKARFDVTLVDSIDADMSDLIRQKVQDIIEVGAPVSSTQMPEAEARALGAVGLFGEKYPDIVTVYTIQKDGVVYSQEFCGGPHAANTAELGSFVMLKTSSIGSGKKRFEFDVR
jgi:alanyl-tRNA synthetase